MVRTTLPNFTIGHLLWTGAYGFAVAIAREVDVGGFEQALRKTNSQRHLAFLAFAPSCDPLESSALLVDRSSRIGLLRAEVEAVVLHLHEHHIIRPSGQVAIEKQDAGLDAAVRIEHTGGQA